MIFLRPPKKYLAGGAPVSQDWKIFWMAVVLGILFIVTVAITVAIPFLQTTLMLDWLNSTKDYLVVGLVVLLWGISLLVIWRIWRLEGIWNQPEPQTAENQVNEDPSSAAEDIADPTPSRSESPSIEF